MYSKDDFLELYVKLERWAKITYGGDDGVMSIEQYHHDKRIKFEARYFRSVRNVLTHNPNGSEKPLIELTDEFKKKFEAFCNLLMNNVSQISIPYKEIYKREINDKVFPTITVMKKNNYTYVPVMNGRKVWGVLCESTVFDIVSNGDASLFQDELQLLGISKYITQYSSSGVYDFAQDDSTVDDICRQFADAIDRGRRLDVIYITTTGNKNGDLVGLVTIWDIPTLYTSL